MSAITNFVRKTPVATLRAYFDATGITLPASIDWTASETDIVHPLLQAVDEMDAAAKDRVVLDAESVSAMADAAGEAALYAVVDDRSVLDGLSGGHDRALWLFLNKPDLFRKAEEARYTDERRRSKSWDGFLVEAGRELRKDPTSLDAFKTAVGGHFFSDNVHVDIFTRRRTMFDGDDSDLVQITVYREGGPKDFLDFEQGQLVRRPRRPVFEAALTYEPATGVVEVVASARESREDIVRIMARDLLGIDFEAHRLPPRCYDLDVLLSPYDFPTDPADGIESVEVRQLRLMPLDHVSERITLESMRGAARTIWTMAEYRFGERNPLDDGWVVTQAKLSIKFRPKAGASRGRVLSFTITMPHGCNLKDMTEEEQLIGDKYFRRWGFVPDAA